MCVFSRVLVTPRTVARQASMSMEFSWQEYWSELPFSPPGDLPNPEIKPTFPALAGRLITTGNYLGSLQLWLKLRDKWGNRVKVTEVFFFGPVGNKCGKKIVFGFQLRCNPIYPFQKFIVSSIFIDLWSHSHYLT